MVAQNSSGSGNLLLLWLLGGILSLAGALCYAELSSTYPEQGGEYVYLNRAYGPWAGFLFGWANLLVIRPGCIAAMAFPFSSYFESLFRPNAPQFFSSNSFIFYAALSTLILSLVNYFGVKTASWTQDVLTILKVIGLLAIFAAALFVPSNLDFSAFSVATHTPNMGLALILVLFCYGGWNEISYVAAEVKNPERNMLRSLCIGTLGVIVLYLLSNLAFLRMLGYEGFQNSKAIAADSLNVAMPGYGASLVSILICISALGAMNGLIFTGSRISYALGKEHSLFRLLSRWHPRFETPSTAILLQGLISLLIIVCTGSFTQVLVYTTSIVWLFYAGTGISVFVLRRKDPEIVRPYKTTGHPFTTLIFTASCIYLSYSAFCYDMKGSFVALGILLLGFPLYIFSRMSNQ